jgi:hypothetical protein
VRVAALLALLVGIPTSAVAPSLQPTGLVNDVADAMYPAARAELQSMLESVAAQGETDLAVVTVPASSTSGLTIEALTRELFRESPPVRNIPTTARSSSTRPIGASVSRSARRSSRFSRASGGAPDS